MPNPAERQSRSAAYASRLRIDPTGRGAPEGELLSSGLNIQAAERKILMVAFGYALASIIVVCVQSAGLAPTRLMLPTLVLAFGLHLLVIRRNARDPLIIQAIALAIYAGVPLLALDASGTLPALGLSYLGAYRIYSAACAAFLCASAFSLAVLPIGNNAFKEGRHLDTMRLAARIASVSSLVLIAVYVVTHGAVALGSTSYEEVFASNSQPGTGVLLLSVPLALAGLCLFLCCGSQLRAWELILSSVPYMFIYITLGNRRALFVPLLLLAVRFFKMRSVAPLVIAVPSVFVAYIAFCYLGFMRTEQVHLHDMAKPATLAAFQRRAPSYVGGEPTVIYATASASYVRMIEPLPMAQDYTKAPLSLLPQFVFGKAQPSTNVRFALTVSKAAALRGLGWGFSFYGEAYLIAGYLGVFAAVFLITFLFRAIYRGGGGALFSGLAGAVSLAAFPNVLWFQRNAFVYFFREYSVEVILIIFCFFAASLWRWANGRTVNVSPVKTPFTDK